VFDRIVTFRRLEVASFTHSTVYLALLLCAFALGGPQPETFIFGLAHGVIWIVMSLVCIAAATRRVVPFWLAVTVAVIGGLGPFAGSIGFVVADRRRQAGLRPGVEPGATNTSQ
jgi:hypothetical protein